METTRPFQPSADNSSFRMIDVGEKPVTRRRAIAQGTIRLSAQAFMAIQDHQNPKGNVLALAEAAGIIAAKKTSELIPLCHPLPLSQVKLRFELDSGENSVTAFCEAVADAKTGVEMEAISGVNGALLTIYDLSKAVDPVITLSGIRLNLKEGGKTGRWLHPDYTPKPELTAEPGLSGLRAAVITVSDRVFAKAADDASGPRARTFLETEGAKLVHFSVVPDEKDLIASEIRGAISMGAQLVVLSGGTGLSPRDVTPDALELCCEKMIPGIGELLRSHGARHTPMSWISRSQAGLLQGSLIIALPGSPKAVEQGLHALLPILPHALHVGQGGNHG